MLDMNALPWPKDEDTAAHMALTDSDLMQREILVDDLSIDNDDDDDAFALFAPSTMFSDDLPSSFSSETSSNVVVVDSPQTPQKTLVTIAPAQEAADSKDTTSLKPSTRNKRANNSSPINATPPLKRRRKTSARKGASRGTKSPAEGNNNTGIHENSRAATDELPTKSTLLNNTNKCKDNNNATAPSARKTVNRGASLVISAKMASDMSAPSLVHKMPSDDEVSSAPSAVADETISQPTALVSRTPSKTPKPKSKREKPTTRPVPVTSTATPTTQDNVDISTGYIHSLLGRNSVSLGGHAENVTSMGGGFGGPTETINHLDKTQHMTEQERDEYYRDRNREHARNTRKRKKAYIGELRRTLAALVSQRDAVAYNKRHSQQREYELRQVRFNVLKEFLKMRGRNETNFNKWASILEANFLLTLPLTPFREMVKASSTGNKKKNKQYQQTLVGVSDAMADSQNLASFLKSLGGNGGSAETSTTYLQYQCDRNLFVMDNCTAVLDWTACSQGAIMQGAPHELALKGSLKATFSPVSNKLRSVALSFDTGIVISQLDEIQMAPVASMPSDVPTNSADKILDSPKSQPSPVPSDVAVVPISSSTSAGSLVLDDSTQATNAKKDDTANTGQRLSKATRRTCSFLSYGKIGRPQGGCSGRQSIPWRDAV